MSESPELLPVTEKKSSCGCHEHSDERLTLDARAIPHRLRHAAVIGAADASNADQAVVGAAEGVVDRDARNLVHQTGHAVYAAALGWLVFGERVAPAARG